MPASIYALMLLLGDTNSFQPVTNYGDQNCQKFMFEEQVVLLHH